MTLYPVLITLAGCGAGGGPRTGSGATSAVALAQIATASARTKIDTNVPIPCMERFMIDTSPLQDLSDDTAVETWNATPRSGVCRCRYRDGAVGLARPLVFRSTGMVACRGSVQRYGAGLRSIRGSHGL